MAGTTTKTAPARKQTRAAAATDEPLVYPHVVAGDAVQVTKTYVKANSTANGSIATGYAPLADITARGWDPAKVKVTVTITVEKG